MTRRASRLVVASLLLAGCRSRLDPGSLEAPDDLDSAVVPLLSDVMPVVHATIEGDHGGVLGVDTGAGWTVVSADAVERWNCGSAGMREIRVPTVRGSVRVDRWTTLDEIDVGEVTAESVDALVLADWSFPGLDGILGLPLIARAPLLIDGSAKHLRFLLGDRLDRILESAYPGATWTRLPLVVEGTTPFVVLDVGDRPRRLLLDSGSVDTSLSRSVIEELGLFSLHEAEVRRVDLSGEWRGVVEFFLVDDLRLGRWTCKVHFAAEAAETGSSKSSDGVLGFDLLSRVPVVIDVRSGALWVQDPEPGEAAILRSSSDHLLERCLTDRWWVSRMYGARGAVYRGARSWIDRAVVLLDDPKPEVRDAAAHAIEELARESWPDAARIEQARSWWAEHRNEAAYAEDGGRRPSE